MKARFILTGLVISLFTLAGFAAQAAAFNAVVQGNEIRGHVFDPNRRPVERVRVELMDDVNAVLQTTFTDGSGSYLFRGISFGRFQVKIYPPGTDFLEETKSVEVIQMNRGGSGLSGGGTEHVEFVLRPRGGNNSLYGSLKGATVFAQEVPKEASKIYEQALTDLKDPKTEEQGLAGLQKALEIFPTYYIALERLGMVYANRQQHEQARATFVKALEVNPRGYMSTYGLGLAQYNLKQSAEAIETLKKSLTLSADSYYSHLWLGLSYRQAKQFSEAEAALIKANQLVKGREPDVHWNLALLYANNLQRYKEAADELEAFLKTQPKARDTEQIKKLIAQFREKAKAAKP